MLVYLFGEGNRPAHFELLVANETLVALVLGELNQLHIGEGRPYADRVALRCENCDRREGSQSADRLPLCGNLGSCVLRKINRKSTYMRSQLTSNAQSHRPRRPMVQLVSCRLEGENTNF